MDISHMVIPVQIGRSIFLIVPNRLGFLLCCGLAGGQVTLLNADLVAVQNVSFRSGQLLIVQLTPDGNLPIIVLIDAEKCNTAAVGSCGRDLLAVQIQSELGTA